MDPETQTSGKAAAASTPKKISLSDNMACMRAMGAPRFDPLPPDQHKWQRLKHWPEVIRLWSWMVAHTCHWPILSPYAVDQEGYELHLENASADLDMDEANVRRAWRLGCRMGLWGNRSAQKGNKYRGQRRLYFYGAVDLKRAEEEAGKPELPKEGEDYTNEKVCTDLFGAFIWKQIKDRPKNEIESLVAEEKAERELANTLQADVVATFRLFITQREDNRWTARGVKVNRQEHTFKNGHAAAYAERQELVQTVYAPALLPVLAEAATKRSVQTASESVQSSEPSEYGVSEKVSTADSEAAILIGQRDSEKPRSLERASGSAPTQRPRKTPPVEQREAANLQPAVIPPEPEPLSPEQQAGYDLLFTKMREYQNRFPHARFGTPLVTPENKGDDIWARRVLSVVPAEEVEAFVFHVGVKLGALPPGMGTLPRPTHSVAKNPRDRYIPLVYDWAVDWVREAPERARRTQEDREAIARRDKRFAENEAALKLEAEIMVAAEKKYSKMALADKAKLLLKARARLNADPQLLKTFNWQSGDQKKELLDRIAINLLVDEMRKGEGVSGESTSTSSA